MFVRSLVRLFLIPSLSWNYFQHFTFRYHKWGISHQPLIRKHSYLNYMYPGGSAFIPRLMTPGFMSRMQLQVKIYDTFKKFFLLSLLWKQIMQIVGQTGLNLMYWLKDHEGKVSMGYISRFSDFALYLQYLMYVHHTLGLWISMTWRLTSK